ncbi:MAG: cyclophilin-like fold protein [Candidatus Methanomethylophilus sp.]|nr:cyclophilin-like fold protein [Methanomethylophilus sp.]MDD3232713.1 cyclophilin-like fold protein [Methanomethylophilus sp.]MDD4221517.1 cyclophilin-like fold protein [Methanomethylophilus sp.]MDD4668348.1 cyclophilin-like fold protein [Methanomethylophilus sp.]
MNGILIRTRNGEYRAELDDSDIGNALWLSLPFTNVANELGDELYFECPLKDLRETGTRQNTFEKGDIAWWPGVGAVCLFFGPTPLSGEDGKPVSKYKCIKIGRIFDDCTSLEEAGDRQRITLLQRLD